MTMSPDPLQGFPLITTPSLPKELFPLFPFSKIVIDGPDALPFLPHKPLIVMDGPTLCPFNVIEGPRPELGGFPFLPQKSLPFPCPGGPSFPQNSALFVGGGPSFPQNSALFVGGGPFFPQNPSFPQKSSSELSCLFLSGAM